VTFLGSFRGREITCECIFEAAQVVAFGGALVLEPDGSRRDAEGFDPDLFVVIDSRTYGERRYQAIGVSRGVILLVAYTMRGDSARRPSRRERAAYTLQTGARSQT
jgi:hypothetical protein